jgi:putative ABC transport system permease protein
VFRTAVRGLVARKLRLITTSVAVLLGVAFMAGTLVLTDTIGRTFDELFADVNAGTDAYVRSADSLPGAWQGTVQRARVSADVLAAVGRVPGVRTAEGTVEGYTQLIDKAGKAMGNPNTGAPTLGGNWRSVEQLNPFDLVEGHAPEAGDEVVIDRGSAKSAHFVVGDTVQLLTPAGPGTARVAGIATFGTTDSPAGASYVLFPTARAQELLAEPGMFDGIAVVAADGVTQAEVRDRIAAAVPADVEVLTGAEITAENQQDIKDDLKFFNTFLLAFALIALFVGSFIIYNTFSIIVAQRDRENALLRAIGASRRQVLGAVLLEATAVGLFASLAGLVAGVAVAAGLKALLGATGIDIPAGSLVVSSSTVVVSLVAGLAVSLASALFPARRAAKVPPVAALRDLAIDHSSRSTRRVIAGVVVGGVGAALLVAGLFGSADGAVAKVGLGATMVFLGVAVLGPVLARPLSRFLGAPVPALRGMPGALARENAMRNPKRTSATASALMIGVGLVGFITIFAASTKATINSVTDGLIHSDFIVDSGSFGDGGFNPALTQRLAAIPEVDMATPIGVVPAEINRAGQDVVAIDPATFGAVFRPDIAEGALSALGADGLAVLTRTAEDNGWHVGDTVPVRFAATGQQLFTVRAIFEFAGGNGGVPFATASKGDFVISRAAAATNAPDTTDSKIFVTVADGVGTPQARAALEQATGDYPTADVQDRDQFKTEQSAQINQVLNLIYALLGLAVIIALIGIANTLALSIYERRRELGLLRAVGMTRQQLRATVRWESVIIALLGTGLGLGVGLFFGWALVTALREEGFDTFHVPVGQLAVIAVIGALAGVTAAVLPARKASRLDTLRAISAA